MPNPFLKCFLCSSTLALGFSNTRYHSCREKVRHIECFNGMTRQIVLKNNKSSLSELFWLQTMFAQMPANVMVKPIPNDIRSQTSKNW